MIFHRGLRLQNNLYLERQYSSEYFCGQLNHCTPYQKANFFHSHLLHLAMLVLLLMHRKLLKFMSSTLSCVLTLFVHLQGVFFNAYFLAYILSPKSCHAFVGYLEEEAVKTYTHAIADIDRGRLPGWSNKKACCLLSLHTCSDTFA